MIDGFKTSEFKQNFSLILDIGSLGKQGQGSQLA